VWSVSRFVTVRLQHGHGLVSIAGCYYVHSGVDTDAAAPDLTTTGVRLSNPRIEEAGRTGKRKRIIKDDKEVPYSPELREELQATEWTDSALGVAGTLALWPGNVMHWVPPHVGDLQRVSIAFNIELSLHDSSGAPTRWKSGEDAQLAEKIQQLLQ
jgi:hypothetical protein